jgi:hypothetical protein
LAVRCAMRSVVGMVVLAACGPSSPPPSESPARAPVATPAPAPPPVAAPVPSPAPAPSPTIARTEAEEDPYLPFLLGDYAGKAGTLYVGAVSRVVFDTLFATDGTVRVFAINAGPEGYALTNYRIVPAAMGTSSVLDTYGVLSKGTTATLVRKAGGWKALKRGTTMTLDDATLGKRFVANKLAAIPAARADVILGVDLAHANAFASGGVDAWIAGAVADGGAFYGISALAIGASKVREAVDEAKGELRTRTPRFARVAPAGNLAVSVGTIGPDPTTYAYLALWQHGTDEQWRLLFFTPVLPQ